MTDSLFAALNSSVTWADVFVLAAAFNLFRMIKGLIKARLEGDVLDDP